MAIRAADGYQTDKQILGYSRYVVFAAAFLAMAVISPYEYAWSSMSGHIGGLYHWSHDEIGWMFTLFVIFESVGTLPGGMLRDTFGPRWITAIAGLIAGLGIYATTLGPSYHLRAYRVVHRQLLRRLRLQHRGDHRNKWFPDKRGLIAGFIAGAFSWGALPFIFPIRAIPKTAPDSVNSSLSSM